MKLLSCFYGANQQTCQSETLPRFEGIETLYLLLSLTIAQRSKHCPDLRGLRRKSAKSKWNKVLAYDLLLQANVGVFYV
jgi:hypothetical protein